MASAIGAEIASMAEQRRSEEYIIDYRNNMTESFTDRDDRIRIMDALLRGDWNTLFPDETVEQTYPYIQNRAQIALQDMARLVTETAPTVRSHPDGAKTADHDEAELREMIAQTSWLYSKADLFVPLWSMDLGVTGHCFSVQMVKKDCEYPVIWRPDPRYCYPDVQNGILQDLIVVTRLKLRVAARLYPDAGLDKMKPNDVDEAEFIQYFDGDECITVICGAKRGVNSLSADRATIVKTWKPEIGKIPVAFAQLPSHDGAFRGLFDQVAGSLNAENRIVRLMLDEADRQVYAPKVEKGVINVDDPEGPNTMYHLDPTVPDAQLGRLAPPQSNPALYNLLQFLEQGQSAGMNYPTTRQGSIPVSQGSASFVSATQGTLTSVVRDEQRLIGAMREDVHRQVAKLDRKHLSYEKPLCRPVKNKNSYVPEKDIGDNYKFSVIYGFGAGLDKTNALVSALQLNGAQIISKETVRDMSDASPDNASEELKIEREAVKAAFLQRGVTELPAAIQAKIIVAQAQGKTFVEALQDVQEDMEKAQAAQEQGAAGAPAPVPGAEEQALALQQGGIPEEAAPGGVGPGFEPNVPLPPSTQVFISPQR